MVRLDPFEFHWPDATEAFETGWEFRACLDGGWRRVRHGLGGRVVYGRERVHTVTWLDGRRQRSVELSTLRLGPQP